MKKKESESVVLTPHAIIKAELLEKINKAHNQVFYGNGKDPTTYKVLEKDELLECAKEVTEDIDDSEQIDSEEFDKCIIKKLRPISKNELKELQTRLGLVFEKTK